MSSSRYQQRILAEIKAVATLEPSGIFYRADDSNICLGRALIFGPEDSVYHHFPCVFGIEFSPDYPFEPPKVRFETSDGKTRFHPNLYVGGKVCLSILGTWQGPAWTSAMSLSTVLLTIQSLLDRDPALHEPGAKSNPSYTLYVQQQAMAFTLRLVDETGAGGAAIGLPTLLRGFEEPWRARIPNILSSYASFLAGRAENELGDLMYGMVPVGGARTRWGALGEMASRLKAKWKENENSQE